MLELHIWGPGLGLPSFDPLCLATVAYLDLTLEEWQLIASSNPLISPTKTLPALRDTATNHWVSGFRPIVEYLAQLSASPADLDADLGPAERAESVAFIAYVSSKGQQLLDLLLYVDGENWVDATRPELSRLLGWPMKFYTPLQLRAAAQQRVEELRLPSSARDDDDLPPALVSTPGEAAVRRANDRQKLRVPLEAIKLESLADTFLSNLSRRLGARRFFHGGDAPTSVDCVVGAFLALLLFADPQKLKQNFVLKVLKAGGTTYRPVEDFAARMRHAWGVKTVDAALAMAGGEKGLPWKRADGDLVSVGQVLLERGVAAVKGDFLPRGDGGEGEGKNGEEGRDEEEIKKRREGRERVRREWWKSVAYVLGGVALFVGYAIWSGVLRIEAGEEGAEDEEAEEEYGGEKMAVPESMTVEDLLGMLPKNAGTGSEGERGEDGNGNEAEKEVEEMGVGNVDRDS